MSSLVLQCPLCSKPFGVLPEQAGQAVQCPNCNQAVRVPAEFESQPPPPTSTVPENEVFGCPVCSGKFAILPEMYGQQVGCPHCQATVLIQSSTSANSPMQTQAQPSSTSISNAGKDGGELAKDEVDDSDLFAPGYKKNANKKTAGKKTAEDNKPPIIRPGSDSTPPAPRIVADHVDSEEPGATLHTQPDAGTESDLPPTNTGVSQVVQPAVEEPPSEDQPDNEPDDIRHLLPPTFDVIDPQMLSFRNRNNPDHKVILPDGKGGLSKVDDRIVTITHKGEQINLISLPPDQLRKKRQIQNTITILIGAVVLAIVVALLRKTG